MRLSILLRDCASKRSLGQGGHATPQGFLWELFDVQIRIVTYGDGSDLSIYIALVRQILEYRVQFGVCVCLNYVGKLKKVQEWAKKIVLRECLTVRSLQLHLFCFFQRKRDDLFTVQKCLNVLKILVTRNLYNIAEKDKNWLSRLEAESRWIQMGN